MRAECAGGRGELCRCIKGHSDVVASFVGHGVWRVVWPSSYTHGHGSAVLLSKSVTNVGVVSSPGLHASRLGSCASARRRIVAGPRLGLCSQQTHRDAIKNAACSARWVMQESHFLCDFPP